MRTFLKTPEGDGHMPWHITMCLTTCADGELIIVVVDCHLFFCMRSELVDTACMCVLRRRVGCLCCLKIG